jgi:phage shock protein PspC (stress-responsive transcriptional regulator)
MNGMTDQDTVPGSPPAPSTSLRRSRRHKVIGGVCGGLGRRYDLDPVIFRVVSAVLAVAGGLGLMAYGFAWLLIPMDGEDENEGRRLLSGRVEGPALTAVLCALVGSGLLLSMLDRPDVVFFSAVVLAALAGAAHWSQQRRRAEQEGPVDAVAQAATGGSFRATGYGGAPPETQAPPTPGTASWWQEPLTKDGPSARRFRGRDRRGIGGWIFLLATTAGTTGILASWYQWPLGRSLEIGLACALAVYGLGLAISARYGRTGAGTIVMALLTCLFLAPAAALPKNVSTGWIRGDWKPASAADVRSRYDLGAGYGSLDLSALKLTKDQSVTTRVSMGAGWLRVVVPRDATVKLTVDLGAGDLLLPDNRQDYQDVAPSLHKRLVLKPADGREQRGTLELRLETGAGRVEVSRASS